MSNKMKKIILVLGLFLCLVFVASAAEDVIVSIETSDGKSSYNAGEEVILLVKMKSVDNTPKLFYNLDFSLFSNDKGSLVSFIQGSKQNVQAPVIPLTESEVDTYYKDQTSGVIYGWNMLGDVEYPPKQVSTLATVGGFKVKLLTVSKDTEVIFDLDKTRSSLLNIEGIDEVPYVLGSSPLKITIKSTSPAQNTVAVQYLEAATLFNGMETVLDGSESQVQKIGLLSSLFITYFKGSKTATNVPYTVKNQTYLILFNNINSILNNNNLNTIGQISNIAYVLKQSSQIPT